MATAQMMEEHAQGRKRPQVTSQVPQVRRLRGYRHQHNLEGCHLEKNPAALTHHWVELQELKETSKTRV